MKGNAFAFVILCVCVFLTGCTARSNPPVASFGILDASSWNFAKQGPIELNGEWGLTWGQFTAPSNSLPASTAEMSTISVPSIWNGKQVGGHSLSGKGYATYTISIRFNPADNMSLKALYIPIVFTSYTLYINGAPTASAGTPGMNKHSTKPQDITQVVYFHPRHNQVTLTFHVSNFAHKKGGIWKPILLGDYKQITDLREKRLIFDAALSSSLLIVGVYHVVIYLLRRKNTSALYFSLFCMLIGVRSIISGRDVLLTKLWPDFNWDLALRIEYLAFYLALPFFSMFIRSLYPEDIHSIFIRTVQILSTLFSLITVLTPSTFYTEAIVPFYGVMLASIFYLIGCLVLIVMRRREFALLNASVAVFFLITAINDVLYYNQIVPIGNMTPFGLFLFIFVQSFTISIKSSRAFTEVERISRELKELNNTLEEKVIERTEKLTSSLKEMAAARAEMSALAERNRIAGEIHDIVGHTLTTTVVQIEAGKRLLSKNLPLAIEKLDLSQELVRNGLNEIRRTIHTIKEDETDLNLEEELKQLIHLTEKHAGVNISYSISPLPELHALQKKFLYHALQEGLTNGIRHGQSARFYFTLQEKDGEITFVLEDEGRGCENIVYGFGLQTMERRAHELHGTLSLTSRPQQGLRLTILLPIRIESTS
ncbi:sensor histidine kinase [Aneurinibacillus sp. REN35]|uniref:sensor histidine kinase n=1 Tax=Aneurinibacillus sp. REN35 TaxID=3237286 RepID=UPI0035289ADB